LTGHRYAWSERRCTGWNKKGPHKHLGKAYNSAALKNLWLRPEPQPVYYKFLAFSAK